MTRRLSTSSEVSSSLSDTTTVCSYTKDGVFTSEKEVQPRKGLRQKARNVVHDLGAPPTRRQDMKEGKVTANHVDVGMMGNTINKQGTA